MTNLEFRNLLVTVLSPVLGTYTDTFGATFPAITLGVSVSPGTKVTGLELVIYPTPDIVPIREFREGEMVAIQRVRSILLKQWDHGESMEPAMILITKHFPTAEAPRVMPATSETIAQAQYDIPETEEV